MVAVPITLREAHAFVAQHHRHHKPSRGAVFAVACAAEDRRICGVAVVGRPKARMLQDGFTAEVTRLATDGTKNACSFLYAASWRAARAMGYRRLVTYILDTEPGTSLHAAGWKFEHQTREGASWDREGRPRVDEHPLQAKMRWGVSVDPFNRAEAAADGPQPTTSNQQGEQLCLP